MSTLRPAAPRFYAEMCGYGATSDAHHITAPDPEGYRGARAIRMAYEQSGVKSERSISSPTAPPPPMNDKTETAAIKAALGDELAHKVVVSSTKK